MGRKLNAMLTAAVVSPALFAGAAHAAVSWESTYEGDVLPTAANPAWTAPESDGTASSDGNILSITTAGVSDSQTGEQHFFRIAGPNSTWDASGKLTLEYRMRVADQHTFDDGDWDRAGAMNVSTGSKRFDMQYYGDDSVADWAKVIQSTGSPHATEQNFDTPNFHTYRIVIDQSQDIYQLYVDGNTTPLFDRSPGDLWNTSDNHISFGDSSPSDMGGTTEWDYIRWTNEEATAPVPEPASLAVGALGFGALLLRRRR